jgi:hypothetical protein
VDKARPFDIPKREVWEAFKKVKENQGAAGVDGKVSRPESGHSFRLREVAPMCYDEGHGERPATKIGHDLHKR